MVYKNIRWLVSPLLVLILAVLSLYDTATMADTKATISGHAIIKSLTGIKQTTKKNNKHELYAFDTPIKFIGDSSKNVKNKKTLDEIGKAMVSEDMTKVHILIRFPVNKDNNIDTKLTKKRARYIKNYLVKTYGISRSRLKTQVR